MRNRQHHPGTLVLVAIVLVVLAVVVASFVGAVQLSPVGVVQSLINKVPFVSVRSRLTPTDETILFQLRLPRVALGAVVGGALALSGAAYQGVFRNALADPYLLGAAAGAGLGATIVISTTSVGGASPSDVVPLAAFVGALMGVGGAYAVGAAADRSHDTATLVLAGVAVSSFLTALQTFVQQQHAQSLQTVYSWILGRLGTGGWHDLLLIAPYIAVSTAVLLAHGRTLDVLTTGDDKAASLGVNVQRTRLVIIVAASLATASAVAVSGLIGFVGIVVPHIVRRLTGSSYRLLLPLSFLGGATFLVVADLVARTVLAPAELPLGVVTAFVGAPFFAALLRRNRRGVV